MELPSAWAKKLASDKPKINIHGKDLYYKGAHRVHVCVCVGGGGGGMLPQINCFVLGGKFCSAILANRISVVATRTLCEV